MGSKPSIYHTHSEQVMTDLWLKLRAAAISIRFHYLHPPPCLKQTLILSLVQFGCLSLQLLRMFEEKKTKTKKTHHQTTVENHIMNVYMNGMWRPFYSKGLVTRYSRSPRQRMIQL